MIDPTFFVYAHRRNDTGDVFYIGKGTRTHKKQYGRAHETKRRSKFWCSIIAKAGYSVEIIGEFPDENSAFDLERQLISKHRRKCDGGTLCNMTAGGDGSLGLPKDPSTIEKLRAASSGSRHPNWGKKLSAETCKKKSESMIASPLNLRGKKLPDWWKEKIAVTKVGDKNPMFGKTGSAHHRSRRVVDRETGASYPSMTAAANSIGMKVGTLYNMLVGTNTNRTQMEFA